jgi:hypothetical protein
MCKLSFATNLKNGKNIYIFSLEDPDILLIERRLFSYHLEVEWKKPAVRWAKALEDFLHTKRRITK